MRVGVGVGVRRWGWVLLGLGAGIVLLTEAGLHVAPPGSFGSMNRHDAIRYIAVTLAAGGLYLGAVWVVRARAVPGWALAGVLLLALVARALVLVAPPVQSTDLYRYVWDGRVQAAGINPYRYIPSDPALAALRDPPDGAQGAGATAIYPNINRRETARTIYPPAAQGLFALIGVTWPSIWAVKGAMLAFDLVAAGVAMVLLRAAGRPLAWVVVWALNPLVIWEFAGGGHIDAAAMAFSGLALLAAARARPGWAGAALGVAVLIKLLPAALFPAMWRPRAGARWGWRTPVVAGVVILAGYAVYASAGWHVFGYLGGYAKEEELDDGGGFLLLRLARLLGPLPWWAGPVYDVSGLLLLGGLAAWVCLRGPLPLDRGARAEVIVRDALVLSAALLAVLSPHYPWYLTMLVLPAVVVPSWAALWPSVAGPLMYLDTARSEVLWPAIVFLPALLLLVFDIHRLRRGRFAERPA